MDGRLGDGAGAAALRGDRAGAIYAAMTVPEVVVAGEVDSRDQYQGCANWWKAWRECMSAIRAWRFLLDGVIRNLFWTDSGQAL